MPADIAISNAKEAQQDDPSQSSEQQTDASNRILVEPNTVNEVIKFAAEEFELLADCCKQVNITPRTAKRLVNIYKILKIIWASPSRSEPAVEVKRVAIAFLALSSRYPEFMRRLFEIVETRFEEKADRLEAGQEVPFSVLALTEELRPKHFHQDLHIQAEWRRFSTDLRRSVFASKGGRPEEEESFRFDRETFHLALTFCFVGDLGYDPDDYHPINTLT